MWKAILIVSAIASEHTKEGEIPLLKDFISTKYINSSNEAAFGNIRATGILSGDLTDDAIWRSAISSRAVTEAKLRYRNAKNNLASAKVQANNSRSKLEGLSTVLAEYTAKHTEVKSAGMEATTASQSRYSSAMASVTSLELALKSAEASAVTLSSQTATITADDLLQKDIKMEILRLQSSQTASAAEATRARAERDGNTRLLYDLQVSLESAIVAQTKARTAYDLSQQTTTFAIGQARDTYATYQADLAASEKIAISDEQAARMAVTTLAQYRVALKVAQANKKASIEDAAHAAWHNKDFSRSSTGSVSGSVQETQSETDQINESWDRVRSTQATVVSVEKQVSSVKMQMLAIAAEIVTQEEIIKTQSSKTAKDVAFNVKDMKSCEQRNEAAVIENNKRMKNAKATWDCDAPENIRCRWKYEVIHLVNQENCNDDSAGKNHEDLATAARNTMHKLKVTASNHEEFYAQLQVKLQDAKIRAKQARDAISFEKAPALQDGGSGISASAVASADASLWAISEKARKVGASVTAKVLKTKIIVVPHEHA